MPFKKLAAFMVINALFTVGIYAQSTPTPEPMSDEVLDLILSATAHLQSGEYDTALEEYNTVLEIDPDNFVAYYGIGDIQYHVLQDCDAAVEAYLTALELEPAEIQLTNPAAVLAYGKIGDCRIKSEDFEGAIEAINQALALSTDEDAFLYYLRGLAYLQLGDALSSAEDYGDALRIDPSFAQYLYETAYNALEEGTAESLDSALFHLNILLSGLSDSADPNLNTASLIPSVMLLRGIVYEQLGDTEAAALDYFNYVSLDRSDSVEQEISIPTINYTVTMEEGRAYWLLFDGSEGDVISVSAVSVPDGDVDPLIVLLGQDDTPLTGQDDTSDDDNNAEIEAFELPADGTYTLIVTHAGGGSEGDIRVSVQVEDD